MKRIFVIILTLLLVDSAFSQNQDSIKAMANAAVKMFTWDIQKAERGTLMFLDVPYQRTGKDSIEYLTMTVAKDKSKQRPEFISIIIPSNICKSNGIFIKFGNKELEKGNPVRVQFEKCNNETCTARIIGGYVTDEETKEKVDVFQKFLDFQHVYFLFTYMDGSHKSVAIPLFSFQNQYKSL
ncbi:MAG: hypothetical protein HXX16_07515 [Bacteroidales bacterium]|nr:hypothetical protein [Bacteroidales bacterium]